MNRTSALDYPLTTLERAFQLARSGRCQSSKDIEQHLKAERFLDARLQLASPSLRKQLAALCREATARPVTACTTTTQQSGDTEIRGSEGPHTPA